MSTNDTTLRDGLYQIYWWRVVYDNPLLSPGFMIYGYYN